MKNQKIKEVQAEPNVSNANLDFDNIKQLLDAAENHIRTIKGLLFNKSYKQEASQLIVDPRANIIEGVFNGLEMIDKNNKKYLVATNYASKSKLVPGDMLKLTITPDGSFIYKQIGPVDRKKIIGVLKKNDDRCYVEAEGKNYNVLTASVTYFKAEEGDKLTIIVPKNKESDWAAVENIINK